MGFSALLLPPSSGICCVGGALDDAGENWSSSRSSLFGRPWILPARLNATPIDRSFRVAAVRSEFREQEKREEEKQKNQLLRVASASIGFNAVLLMSVTKPALPVSRREEGPYNWLSLPLVAVWGAILLNAFVQFRILERLTALPLRRGSSGGRVDFSLNQRVSDLEENVREFLITARALSKQVEKLGVRFRATKRTLRDPMKETATIAQKTSEVANILAQREDRLEEELRGLQLSLLAMQEENLTTRHHVALPQEHQMKQLSLITLALKRTHNNRNNNEAQATKTLSSSVNGSNSSGTKTSADTHARVTAQDVESPKKSVENRSTSNGTSSTSEGSLSKIDFWKDSATTSAVVEKMTVGAEKSKQSLGSFFNGRKRKSSPPETTTNALNADSESPVLPEAAECVEQPDYDSDSWLR